MVGVDDCADDTTEVPPDEAMDRARDRNVRECHGET